MAGGACVGVCVVGASVVRGAWVQERWPLKRAVRILLECILVIHNFPGFFRKQISNFGT